MKGVAVPVVPRVVLNVVLHVVRHPSTWTDPPSPGHHCERVAGVEVTLKAGPNYQKTFFRCYNPPTKAQCRFFAWTLEQPLRDYTYAAARLRVQQGGK